MQIVMAMLSIAAMLVRTPKPLCSTAPISAPGSARKRWPAESSVAEYRF
jgi:adenine-specific DNA glycosylase